MNPVVTRPDNALIRAAELEREARAVDQRAVFHASRAESARAAVARLQDVLPASFGEERDAIFERIDALLERAAAETGEARTLRLRASELRAQASRLRQGQGPGGGWNKRRVSRPAALDV